jgi:ribosome-associated protein
MTQAPPDSTRVAIAAARAAADKQATDVVVLDVREVLVITDLFVICTAGNPRQLKTVIEAIEERIRGMGERPVRREGEPDAGWWLLDYIDVVVHVFAPEQRAYYDLERLWRDAPKVDWETEPPAAAGSGG